MRPRAATAVPRAAVPRAAVARAAVARAAVALAAVALAACPAGFGRAAPAQAAPPPAGPPAGPVPVAAGVTLPAGPRPVAAAAPVGCTAAGRAGQPQLQVTVQGMEPHTIEPGGTVRIAAELRNCGSTPLGQLRIRLRTGEELFTRTQLAAADTQPLTERAAGSWADLAPLAAGRSQQATYQTTAQDLRLTAIGVYPAEVEVQAAAPDGTAPALVGWVRTYLPYFPDPVAAPTQVTWLLPFTDRPHRLYQPEDDTGEQDRVLIDNRLAGQLSGNGRLNRLLTLAEQADTAGIPFAIAVDPELVDTVHEMATGYRVLVNSRTTVAGSGRQTAVAWLGRLSALAGRHEVFALPYADTDLVALSGYNLVQLARTGQAALSRLAGQLRATVDDQIAWPAGGLLTDRALDTVVGQGATTVVLDAASLPNAAPAAGGRTQSAVSPLPSVSGSARALVADAALSRLVSGAVAVPGGPRLAEQRYLAELAMITAEAPSVQRRILIAPPHDWSPSPAAASAMIRATRTVPWLAAGSLATLLGSAEPVDRGALVYPRGAPQLPLTQIGRIHKLQQLIDQFHDVLDNRAASRVLERFTTALQRAASSFWRVPPGAAAGSPAGIPAQAGAAFLAPIANRIKTIVQDDVYIVRPQDGKYSLASRNGALPVTVVNKLDVSVRVRVRLSGQGTVGFYAQDTPVTLDAGKRTLLRIKTTVTRSGRFPVQAALLTPDGDPLNRPIALTVQSTAYGTVALGITGAAFALLLLLLIRRIVQRIRAEQQAPVPAAGSPGERKT
jgi:hypothetical protein